MNTTRELWRCSPSLPDYLVSNYGRVMRVPVQVTLPSGGIRSYGGTPWFGVDGGEGRMTIQYKGKTYKVHRLVCEAFNGPQPDGSVCIHINEDYTDNRPENLKWGTQKENLNGPKFLEYCRSRTGENSPTTKNRRARA